MDKDGVAPVHVAAEFNHVGVLRVLGKCGADLSQLSTSGVTAAFVAVENGNLEVGPPASPPH